LKWWITNYFADHVDIIHTCGAMGNNESTERQLRFLHLFNPSVFVLTTIVGRTGLILTAANQEVITKKFWVLNE
jgi:hypothetical protein